MDTTLLQSRLLKKRLLQTRLLRLVRGSHCNGIIRRTQSFIVKDRNLFYHTKHTWICDQTIIIAIHKKTINDESFLKKVSERSSILNFIISIVFYEILKLIWTLLERTLFVNFLIFESMPFVKWARELGKLSFI